MLSRSERPGPHAPANCPHYIFKYFVSAVLSAFLGAFSGTEPKPKRCGFRCSWGAVWGCAETPIPPMPAARLRLALAFSGVRPAPRRIHLSITATLPL